MAATLARTPPAVRRRPFRAPPRTPRRARFRPFLLARWIGRRALRPPPADLEPPPAPRARPEAGPAGEAIPDANAGLDALDETDPAALERDRRPGAHWDGGDWHDGEVRGLIRGGRWLALRRDGTRWWAFADARAEVRHDGAWWTKEGGVWLVVHDGQPWAWRSFQDWDAQGLFHPATGTEMVYSRDFSRVAVIAPGEGAELFDAASGASLGRIPERLMPSRRRPRAPAAAPEGASAFDG